MTNSRHKHKYNVINQGCFILKLMPKNMVCFYIFRFAFLTVVFDLGTK